MGMGIKMEPCRNKYSDEYDGACPEAGAFLIAGASQLVKRGEKTAYEAGFYLVDV